MSDLKKFEKIIPVGKQEFAYQNEGVSTTASIRGSIPYRTGTLPYINEEKDIVGGYELRIYNHTNNSLVVELIKKRTDTVKQRKEKGFATYQVVYQVIMSFSDLVNQIFRNIEVGEYPQDEGLPEEVQELMKKVYKQ